MILELWIWRAEPLYVDCFFISCICIHFCIVWAQPSLQGQCVPTVHQICLWLEWWKNCGETDNCWRIRSSAPANRNLFLVENSVKGGGIEWCVHRLFIDQREHVLIYKWWTKGLYFSEFLKHISILHYRSITNPSVPRCETLQEYKQLYYIICMIN